jgi:uncharacterized membrane protein
MKILISILFILFLACLSGLVLSILNMISSDKTKNIVIGVICGLFTFGYLVALCVVRYEEKKRERQRAIEEMRAVQVEGQ